jgi:hypothetical protein
VVLSIHLEQVGATNRTIGVLDEEIERMLEPFRTELTVTVCPAETSKSTTWLPMKPAPPVTNQRSGF